MIFFSYTFAIACALFFILFWLVRDAWIRQIVLLCACLLFEWHYAGPAGVLPIVILALGTYAAGRSRDKRLCIAWIAICVLSLAFYKYSIFLVGNIVGALSPAEAQKILLAAKTFVPAAPPLAISFFIFEFVHYLIEIYRGHEPIRSPLRFTLFATFWPTLVAGPIKRYQQFEPQLINGLKTLNASDIYVGILRICIGIVKKFAADTLTAWIANAETLYNINGLAFRWLFLVALGMRILLDFSGYSDMAIGFARMMGIVIPENFNWPYLATSVTDFWRRWHISLSSWIRDYVYIPLGGSRAGLARKFLNALIAMTLCGLWHGAAWNFAIWGIYHGFGLILSGAAINLYAKMLPAKESPRALRFVLSMLGWACTFLFVHIGWLMFFYPIGRALQMSTLLFAF
jgi:alginate O-acetyltransferase complex protein AlgI